MEQREGRIHRYKNHAVRKNVAARTACQSAWRPDGDPWAAMFTRAADARAGENDLVPSWIYTAGHARIERYVPTLRSAVTSIGRTR